MNSILLRTVLLGATLGMGIHPALADSPSDFRKRASASNLTIEDRIADVEAELEVGRDVAARVLGRYAMVKSDPLTRYINLVGRSVALHGARDEISFRFAVLDSETINAYAAPGGYVFVTRGALAAMRDESELAAVLAHEIAHVNQKHIVKELNIRGNEDSTGAGLSRLLGGASDPARVAFAQAIDKAMNLLFEAGLKKEDEFEADRVGTLLTAAAGYDPTALQRYLVRVRQIQGKRTAVLDATHPSFDARIAALDQLLRSEQLDRIEAPRLAQRFEQNLK